MAITYREDSPSVPKAGVRYLSTKELIAKQAGYKLKAAEISKSILDCCDDDEKKDLRNERAEIRRKIAVIDVRLSERIVSV